MLISTARWSDHKVALPPGEVDGLRVEQFEVPEQSVESMRLALSGRHLPPGTYTRLMDRGRLWMSDTPDEWRDHLEAVYRIRQPETRRVLINGLGIGMVLKAALACEHVEHVDVVEVDPRVVALVGPHYADPRLTIHTADAHAINWPVGTRWDVAWHDIWADMCEDNLPSMATLHRRYGRRVGWQGSWSKELVRAERRRTSGAWWR